MIQLATAQQILPTWSRCRIDAMNSANIPNTEENPKRNLNRGPNGNSPTTIRKTDDQTRSTQRFLDSAPFVRNLGDAVRVSGFIGRASVPHFSRLSRIPLSKDHRRRSELSIQFNCENGHRIRAELKHAGQHGICPRCRVPIQVPLLPANKKRSPAITESGVMRVLSDADLAAPKSEPLESPKRSCPRCKKPLSTEVTLCRHCKLYVGLGISNAVANPQEQMNLL